MASINQRNTIISASVQVQTSKMKPVMLVVTLTLAAFTQAASVGPMYLHSSSLGYKPPSASFGSPKLSYSGPSTYGSNPRKSLSPLSPSLINYLSSLSPNSPPAYSPSSYPNALSSYGGTALSNYGGGASPSIQPTSYPSSYPPFVPGYSNTYPRIYSNGLSGGYYQNPNPYGPSPYNSGYYPTPDSSVGYPIDEPFSSFDLTNYGGVIPGIIKGAAVSVPDYLNGGWNYDGPNDFPGFLGAGAPAPGNFKRSSSAQTSSSADSGGLLRIEKDEKKAEKEN